MTRIPPLIPFSLTLVLLAANGFWPVAQADSDEEARAAELARVQSRIKALQAELDRDLGEKRQLVQQLREVETQVGDISKALTRLGAEVKDREDRLSALVGERGRLRKSMAEQRDALASQIRASYTIGRQERLKMLLNQEDPSAVGRMLAYYDYFNRARSKQIDLVNANLNRLTVVERDIQDEKRLLEATMVRQAADRDQLDSKRAERGQVLAKLDSRIEDKGQQLKQLQGDVRRLAKLLKSLEDVTDALAAGRSPQQQPFSNLRGKLPWPAPGRIVGDFGSSRAVGNLSWQGVMIRASAGDEVRAISHGRVAFADWLRGFGLLVIIDHGDGYMSLYGHNQSLFKELGDWVEGGELIATVGDSGGLEEAGLYFELRRDGEPINPRQWCRRAQGNLIGMN